MEQWFSQKARTGDNALRECTKILSDYLSSNTKTSPASTASAIVTSVQASSKPADTGFEVTNLLLDTVAQFVSSVTPIITLLPAIRAIQPTPNQVYYHFDSMHRENYDGISGLRYLCKPPEHLEDEDPNTTSGGRWVNYNTFTVELATSGYDDRYFMFGFFCLRDTLEKETQSRETEFKEHIRPFSLKRSAIDATDLLSYDLMAAAIWVITGASQMYRLGNSVFGEGLERGIAVKTDFWNAEPGFSLGRWNLWCGRFRWFAKQSFVMDGVRGQCKEAVVAIEKVLLTKVE